MSISYDITSRNWDNTDVGVNITDDDGFNGIKDIDNDNASFSEGTLTDVVAVDDSLQLANNYALSFDGIDDYAAISNGSFLNLNTATIEIETYIDRTLNSEKLSIIADTCIYTGASKGGWVLALDDRDARNYHFRVGVQDSTSWIIDLQTELVDYFPTAKIYNIVLVFKDSDYISIFVDGTEVYTTMISTTPVSSGLDLSLGGVSDNWFLKCQMNYFRIWNTARTQTEIQNNINTELIGNETGLVAYYKMDTGTGTTLTDYAGTNDGTIYGSSWVDDYTPQGNRIAPQLDLSTIDVVDSSVISWSEALNENLFTDSDFDDAVNTWSAEIQYDNGGAVDNGRYGADTSTWGFYQDVFISEGYRYKISGYVRMPSNNADVRISLDSTDLGQAYVDTNGEWTYFEYISGVAESSRLERIHILDKSKSGNEVQADKFYIEKLDILNINIETSVDNQSTWQTVTNGGSIPNISGASTLDVRQTLSTDDTTVTPVLESLTVEVETPIQHNWSLDTSTPSSWNDVSNPLTQSSEGEWYLHTRHFEDNNPVTEYTGTYNIDKTPPAVPNVNLTNNTSHSFSLDWTNDDSLSGIDYVELYAKTSDGTVIDINGDSNTEDYITLTATDDTYTVDGLSEYSDYDYKVITYDKAGNSSADGFYTMTTDDITEPVIGYNVNSTSWQNTDVDETVNVDDAGGSGVANAWYKWTNSATQPTDGWVVMGTTTDFSTPQSQEGKWYLHIKATDNYDNTAYDYSGAYKIDKTVPTISSTNISIDSPTGIYDTYTATVTWTIEDDRAGVDRTEIGFYVDGTWYYDETNLPDGITADIDMDNVTGNGSKTATFSNVPREIDIATSWQGYDIATNETVEEQSETVYTPRIYETYTTVTPTSYEIGKTDTLIIPTEYEIGITDSTQSPSEYIIDVLSKSTSAPSVYGIGLTQASTIAPSEYEIGITDSKSAPSLYDIIALYDEPILVSGKYKQGLRIGTSDIEVDVSEFSGGWTMHLFRRGEQDKEFRDIFALSSGDVYIDGEVDESYDTSWFTHTEDKITIKSGAIDIDELLIIPYELVPSEIKTLTGSAFYDTSPNITIGKPSTANMEVL